MNNSFDDIRPYRNDEIAEAMHRIAGNSMLPVLAGFVFPDKPLEVVRDLLRSIDNIYDFQSKVMYVANRRIIENSIVEFTFSGLEHIDKEARYVYMSNHRDIMLDASLLQNVLLDNGMDTTEITFGANLMQGGLVIDIGKSNKMFKVERPGCGIREFYKASKHLSEYIRHTITEKRQSVWIAQRNGRTKDGLDHTDQGIINMFRMSGDDDKVRSLAELNILPVAVSYEWEPCDIFKTLELYARSKGPYVKKEGEDLNSILTGILQPKGRVHFQVCAPVTENDLMQLADLSSNEFNKQVAAIIDRRICQKYRLWPNNYIAYDLQSQTSVYKDHYTESEKETFIGYMHKLDKYADEESMETLKNIFLSIYANPVRSAENNM